HLGGGPDVRTVKDAGYLQVGFRTTSPKSSGVCNSCPSTAGRDLRGHCRNSPKRCASTCDGFGSIPGLGKSRRVGTREDCRETYGRESGPRAMETWSLYQYSKEIRALRALAREGLREAHLGEPRHSILARLNRVRDRRAVFLLVALSVPSR